MRWLYTFALFIICTTYTTADLIHTVDEFFENCTGKYTIEGYMDIYYLSVDPFSYRKLDTIHVHRSLRYSDFTSHEPDFKTDSLLKAGCICTAMPINSHEYIVMPLMIDGLMSDALTLCIFRDAHTSITSVLDVPTDKLQHYMMAQYMAKMPRSLVDFDNKPPSSCINLRGQPSSVIPGQYMCFYYNYVMYKVVNDYYEIEEEKVDYGPFLGTQLPDFKYLKKATTDSLMNFTTQLAVFNCALVKNHTLISTTFWDKRCYFQTHRNPPYFLEIVGCCCTDYYSFPCGEYPTTSIRINKTYCRRGTHYQANAGFGIFCSARIFQHYELIHVNGLMDNFEYISANGSKEIDAYYLNVDECNPSVNVICDGNQVRVNETACCSKKAYCNSHRGANMLIQRCYLSFAEDFKTAGCAIVFYRYEKDGNKKWNIVSPAWFDMTKSKLLHLYSSTYTTDETTKYNISIGFMVAHPSDSSCDSKKPRLKRTYFVLNCYPKTLCDSNFDYAFFNALDEKIVYGALEKSNISRCEEGYISFLTSDNDLTKLPLKTDTTLQYGLYCELRLSLDYVGNKRYEVKISFGPVFPKPDVCIERLTQLDGSFVCCYEARSDPFNSKCHYTTVLEKMKAITDGIKEEESEADSILGKLGTHEHLDDCEQRIAGRFGEASRHCAPGGVGCFHLLRMDLSKKEVVASCIGYAENMIASDQEYYDSFGEALTCLTPESKDSCQYVYEGSELYLLCCCQADEVYNHVAQCAEDSKTMFHESSQALKKVGEFAEPSENDEKL